MKAYLPYYNNGWKVAEIETNRAKYRHTSGYSASITYQGTIYNGEHVYNCERGAWLYINKEYHEAMQYQVMIAM